MPSESVQCKPLEVAVGDKGIERAIKHLKRKLASEGILRELKSRRHYLKPSVKRRKKQAEAARRRRKRAKADQELRAPMGGAGTPTLGRASVSPREGGSSERAGLPSVVCRPQRAGLRRAPSFAPIHDAAAASAPSGSNTVSAMIPACGAVRPQAIPAASSPDSAASRGPAVPPNLPTSAPLDALPRPSVTKTCVAATTIEAARTSPADASARDSAAASGCASRDRSSHASSWNTAPIPTQCHGGRSSGGSSPTGAPF